MFDLPEILK